MSKTMAKIVSPCIFLCSLVISFSSHHAYGADSLLAKGKEQSGLEFLRECNGTFSDDEVGKKLMKFYCLGYISGITDAQTIIGGVNPGSKIFCPPSEGLENEQSLRIIIKWLEDHPEQLHMSARISVFIALSKALPCNK